MLMQEEWIDYEETFAPVARLEAIRMLLAFACFKDFVLYQMDVKNTFLNGFINEEVCVEQWLSPIGVLLWFSPQTGVINKIYKPNSSYTRVA